MNPSDSERFIEADRTDPVDYWIDLECPICGHDGAFDGQGRDRKSRYIHRCGGCNSTIHVPNRVNGYLIGTGP